MWSVVLTLCLVATARGQTPTTQPPEEGKITEETTINVPTEPTTTTTVTTPEQTTPKQNDEEQHCVAVDMDFTELRPALEDLHAKFKGRVDEYSQIDQYNTDASASPPRQANLSSIPATGRLLTPK